jgi:hypothetical protein
MTVNRLGFAISGRQREAQPSDTHDDQVLTIAREHDATPTSRRPASGCPKTTSRDWTRGERKCMFT